jgi:hypothetical protein
MDQESNGLMGTSGVSRTKFYCQHSHSTLTALVALQITRIMIFKAMAVPFRSA